MLDKNLKFSDMGRSADMANIPANVKNNDKPEPAVISKRYGSSALIVKKPKAVSPAIAALTYIKKKLNFINQPIFTKTGAPKVLRCVTTFSASFSET